MDEFDLYGNSSKLNERSSLNGERIATIRSLVSVYERRLKRFQEEKKILTDLTEFQYDLINKLGITPNNMILSPVENQQSTNDDIDNFSESNDDENENNASDKSKKNENDKSAKKINKLLYTPIRTDYLLNFLKKELMTNNNNPKNKFRQKSSYLHAIFQKFPIIESTFFDNNSSLTIQPICEYIQTLNQEKRQEFYSEFWSSINNLPFILNTLFSLLKSDSFHSLSELVEISLSQSLNFTHSLLYLYDAEKSLLTIEKQKVNVSHVLSDGLISNAIKKNNPILVDRNDPNIKDDDLSIMVKQQKGLFIPIPKISAVLAFFDKIEKFTPVDDLIAHSSASIISEIGHAIQLHKQMNDEISTFQGISDILIELSSMTCIRNFLNTMSASLTKRFNCSNFCLFKVSQSSHSFWKFESPDNNHNDITFFQKQITFPIGHGIVGYSIAKKSIMTISRPEFSILFENDSDRPETGIKINSILCCPIFNEKEEVKWSIVLYNKLDSDNFSMEDEKSIEILTLHLHPIIVSVLNASNLSDEMKLSKRTIEDMNHIIEFISELSNLKSLSDIALQVTKKMNQLVKTEKSEIFTINQRLNLLIGENDDGTFYMHQLTPESEDPIIKFTLANQLKEEKVDSLKKIYCPLIGIKSNVIGMMVLTSKEEEIAETKSDFSIVSSRSGRQSKLQLKLNFLNQKQKSSFNSISNQRERKIFSSWSKIVGKFVDVIEDNKKVQQLILLEERMLDSLSSLDKKTILFLYPQIELNFIDEEIKYSKSEETVPLFSLSLNDDLYQNYISLMSILHQLPNHCHFLNMKMKKIEKKFEIEENFDEFPISHSFDVFQYNEKQISNSLMKLMNDLEISKFFNFGPSQIQKCIDSIRSLHLSKQFTNWQLSIDRIQFLNYFLNQTNLLKKFTRIQKAAIFFYLISINCEPIVSSNSSLAKSRYFLESGSSLNIGTTVFTVLSSIPDSPFFKLGKEEQSQFFNELENLSQINEIEISLTNDLLLLTALICSFSYLARDFEVSKNWVKLRFDEDSEKVEKTELFDDIVRYQLEFEMRLLIQPSFNEFTKNSIRIDEIRNCFTECLTKMTSINF